MDRNTPNRLPCAELAPSALAAPHRPRLSRTRAAAVTLGALLWSFWMPGPADSAAPPAFMSRLLAPDPEWQAMRGARAATGPGLAASLGNPAAVSGICGGAAACSHLQWAGGLSREWFGAGWTLDRGIAAAVDAAILRGPELPGYDADGRSTGSFQATEWNAGLQAAVPLGGGFSAGGGARLFRLEQGSEPLTGVGFSLGIQARGATRAAGLAVTDAGGPPSGGRTAYAYSLPTRWRAGFEQEAASGRVLVVASVEGKADGEAHAAFGVVTRPAASLELMGGLLAGDSGAGDSPVGWSAGAAVSRGVLSVSYAFQHEPALGSTHLVGLRLALPGARGWSAFAAPQGKGTAPEPPAAASASPAAPDSGYGVFGGRYGTSEAADSELGVIRSKGFPEARAVALPDGRWRVLVRECGSAEEGRTVVSRLRAWAIDAAAEPLAGALPLAGPDSP